MEARHSREAHLIFLKKTKHKQKPLFRCVVRGPLTAGLVVCKGLEGTQGHPPPDLLSWAGQGGASCTQGQAGRAVLEDPKSSRRSLDRDGQPCQEKRARVQEHLKG